MDEDHPLTSHNPYGFSKVAAELTMWAWQRAYEVLSVVLSTGVVIGPGMRREVFILGIIANFSQRKMAKRFGTTASVPQACWPSPAYPSPGWTPERTADNWTPKIPRGL